MKIGSALTLFLISFTILFTTSPTSALADSASGKSRATVTFIEGDTIDSSSETDPTTEPTVPSEGKQDPPISKILPQTSETKAWYAEVFGVGAIIMAGGVWHYRRYKKC